MKRANGSTLRLALFDDVKGGRNALILGPTCSGKTTLLQEIVASVFDQGTPKARTRKPQRRAAR